MFKEFFNSPLLQMKATNLSQVIFASDFFFIIQSRLIFNYELRKSRLRKLKALYY